MNAEKIPPAFYYESNGTRHGPVSSRQLKELARSGKILTSDKVWQEGSEKVYSAGDVKGLFLSLDTSTSKISLNKVFISYSNHDKSIADAVCHSLEENGLRCWIAPRDIIPGSTWSESIIDGLDDSAAFVLVFSANANRSQQVLREVERAISKGITVVPFRVEDVKPTKGFEYCISLPHWLDAMTPPLEKHIATLVSTVRKICSPAIRNQDFPDKVNHNSLVDDKKFKLSDKVINADMKGKKWKTQIIVGTVSTVFFMLSIFYFTNNKVNNKIQTPTPNEETINVANENSKVRSVTITRWAEEPYSVEETYEVDTDLGTETRTRTRTAYKLVPETILSKFRGSPTPSNIRQLSGKTVADITITLENGLLSKIDSVEWPIPE